MAQDPVSPLRPPPKFGPNQPGPQSDADWVAFYRWLVNLYSQSQSPPTPPQVSVFIPPTDGGGPSEQRAIAEAGAFSTQRQSAIARPSGAAAKPLDTAELEAYSPARMGARIDELNGLVAMLLARPVYSPSQAVAAAQVTVAAPGVVTPLNSTGSPGVPPSYPLYNATVVGSLPLPGDPLSVGGSVVVFGGIYYLYTTIEGINPNWYALAYQGQEFNDTRANRIANYDPTKYPLGTTYNETDTLLKYVVQLVSGANAWLFFSGYWRQTQIAVPTVGATLAVNDNGLRVLTTDTQHSYVWNGTVFHFDADRAGYQLFWPTAGYPFGLTAAQWGLCDGSVYAVSQDDGSRLSVVTPVAANTYMRL